MSVANTDWIVVALRSYQFNTLRHGRYSTMMMLYYLLGHKQLAPVTKKASRAERSAKLPAQHDARKAISDHVPELVQQ